jgi:hypothetical protein
MKYLRYIMNQKHNTLNQETVCGSNLDISPSFSGTRGSRSLHLTVSQATAMMDWQTYLSEAITILPVNLNPHAGI